MGSSLVASWLGCLDFHYHDAGSDPGWGTEILKPPGVAKKNAKTKHKISLSQPWLLLIFISPRSITWCELYLFFTC